MPQYQSKSGPLQHLLHTVATRVLKRQYAFQPFEGIYVKCSIWFGPQFNLPPLFSHFQHNTLFSSENSVVHSKLCLRKQSFTFLN